MYKFLVSFLISAAILAVIPSCKVPNRMFQTDENADTLKAGVRRAESNYIIQPNDYISLSVYSSNGEKLIDPDNELTKIGVGSEGTKAAEPPKYLVKVDGTVNLPMVGNVYLKGFTLFQADSVLKNQYSKYYKDPFVITKLLNKRVFVLGAGTDGAGKVILLENENMNLIEVLAMYGGITDDGKSYNIKLIRGDLKNPEVQVIDLSTIEGMKKASLAVYPNDIIYIEQKRKVFVESLREIVPIVSIFMNVTVALIVIFRK